MALFKGTKKEPAKAAKTTEDKAAPKEKEAKTPSMKDLYGAGAPAKTEKGGTKAAAKKRTSKGIAYRILVKPLITEKVSIIGQLNKYGFEVSTDANKILVADAIEEVYGVRPASVNIVTIKGKAVRYGRVKGKRKDRKKAYITLPAGKSIKLYEGV